MTTHKSEKRCVENKRKKLFRGPEKEKLKVERSEEM
jgi:hypothetical protein